MITFDPAEYLAVQEETHSRSQSDHGEDDLRHESKITLFSQIEEHSTQVVAKPATNRQ